MPIYRRCTRCKTDNSQSNKTCSKCRASLEDSPYRVIVSGPDGKRLSKTCKGIQGARDAEALLKEGKDTVHPVHPHPTLRTAWNLYRSWAMVHTRSVPTMDGLWGKVEKQLGDLRMESIKPFQIQRVLDQLLVKGYTPQTVKHVFSLVRRLFNWSHKQGLYEGGIPTKQIDPPKVNNERIRCLSQDELARLMGALEIWENRRFALLVLFTLYTGLRKGEVFNLTWENVDLDRGFISLVGQLKGGKNNVLPICKKAQEVLKEAKGLAGDSPYVFPSRYGQKRDFYGNSWKALLAKAGITNFRFHDLRHTFASYLISSGSVELYTVQKLLTHKSPLMTQRYAHLGDKAMKNAVGVLDNLL